MNERNIHSLIGKVKSGAMTRRAFVDRMVAVGLTAPMAGMMLMHHGVANSQTMVYKPTKRGGGGALKLIYWQAAVHLNPHYAGGTKDQDASRVFYEPLASWDSEGNLVPILAAEAPDRQRVQLKLDSAARDRIGKTTAVIDAWQRDRALVLIIERAQSLERKS